LDNTVIIFTTDHYPYTLKKKKYEAYTGITEDYQKMHSPLIIWSKVLEPMQYDDLSSSFDLLPTLANLFQLDADYAYYPGYDLFQEDIEPIVLFKDYSWYDGVNYVKDGELVQGVAGKKKIEELSNKINETYNIGRKILQ